MADIEKRKTSQEIEHACSKSQIMIESEPLVQHLRELIENTRKRVASVVSDETSQLYWNVGNAINTFVLQGNRAEYGKQIVATVSRQLAEEYGSGFEEKNVRRMMQFANEYQDFEIVATGESGLTVPVTYPPSASLSSPVTSAYTRLSTPLNSKTSAIIKSSLNT